MFLLEMYKSILTKQNSTILNDKIDFELELEPMQKYLNYEFKNL